MKVERLAVLAGAASALLVIVAPAPLLLQVLATVYLFAVAPGLLLVRALAPAQPLPVQLVLSVGASLAISITSVLFIVLWGGPPVLPTLLIVAAANSGLAAAAAWWLARHAPVSPPQRTPRRVWLALLAVLTLAAVFRFHALGYAEFQDDELDVANVAMRVVRGETAALLSDRRGPAQTVLTLIFALTTGSVAEGVLRTPAALANLLLLATMFVATWRMFTWRVAFIAGALLSLEGFVLAYGRVVQMQSTLLAMMALAVLALVLRTPSGGQRSRMGLAALAALYFVVGVLAHYEMLLLAPVLLYLYVHREGVRFWRRDGTGAAVMTAVVLVIGGLFYIPFLRDPAFTTTYAYYSDDIVGRSLQNNLHQFALIGAFYNSPYYFALMWLSLGCTWAATGWRAIIGGWQRALAAGGIAAAMLVLTLQLAGMTNFGAVTAAPFGLAAALGIVGALLSLPHIPFPMRLLTLWFFVFFIPYSFFLRDVHIHYYAYSLPWAVLSALTFDAIYRSAHALRGVRVAYAAVAGVLLLLFAGYTRVVFLQPAPEYALTYPVSHTGWLAHLFPALSTQRHGEAFGFPHKSGWKTIGALYRAGVLRGGYETNELHLKAAWYTRRQLQDETGRLPRYYFVATVPHRLQAAPWPPPLDRTAYRLTGVVTVQGQPRLEIYTRNDDALDQYERDGQDRRAEVQVFANETYEPLFDAVNHIEDARRQANFQADDHFFRSAARFLEETAGADSPVILFSPAQGAIFNYYFEGDNPYLTPASDDPWLPTADWKPGTSIYALFWAEPSIDPASAFERWLNERLFKMGEQWFGNVRLVRYQTPFIALPAAPASDAPRRMHLGDAIDLLGYTLTVQDGVQLSLAWQATQSIQARYKVFVQLRNATDQIIAQNDSEPGGGRQPTDGWPVATSSAAIIDNYALALPPELPAGVYRLAVGLYLPATGERLPVYDEEGIRQPNDEIIIETILAARQ